MTPRARWEQTRWRAIRRLARRDPLAALRAALALTLSGLLDVRSARPVIRD